MLWWTEKLWVLAGHPLGWSLRVVNAHLLSPVFCRPSSPVVCCSLKACWQFLRLFLEAEGAPSWDRSGASAFLGSFCCALVTLCGLVLSLSQASTEQRELCQSNRRYPWVFRAAVRISACCCSHETKQDTTLHCSPESQGQLSAIPAGEQSLIPHKIHPSG